MKRIALLFGALIAADVLTTAYGFHLGALEGNPAQGVVIAAFGLLGAGAVKVVGTVAMLALIRLLEPRLRTVFAVPGLLALSLPVAWNVVQLASVA